MPFFYCFLAINDWFFLLQVENDSGAMVSEFSGLLQYRISKDAIGKFISVKCTPVRDDGTVGEPRTYMGQERVRPGNDTFPLIGMNFKNYYDF